MNAGLLRQKIVIQKKTTSKDGDGYPLIQWADYLSCRAYVNGLSGREFFAAMAEHAENTVVFEVRYQRVIESMNPTDYRIVFRGKQYDIIGIDNVMFKNDTVKFRALEGVTDG